MIAGLISKVYLFFMFNSDERYVRKISSFLSQREEPAWRAVFFFLIKNGIEPFELETFTNGKLVSTRISLFCYSYPLKRN